MITCPKMTKSEKSLSENKDNKNNTTLRIMLFHKKVMFCSKIFNFLCFEQFYSIRKLCFYNVMHLNCTIAQLYVTLMNDFDKTLICFL